MDLKKMDLKGGESMTRKVWLVGLVAALLVFPGTGFAAVVLDLTATDTTSGDAGAGTLYHLVLDQTGATSYTGTFTAQADSTGSTVWNIGWWSLHLDTNTAQSLTLTGAPADASPGGGQIGSWSGVGTGTDIDIHQQTGWPADQYVGAYNLGIDEIGTFDKLTGAVVNGGALSTWTFTFTGLMPSQFNDPVNFQVGYYNSATTNGAGGPFPRLSQDFQVADFQVAEPSTLILVGVGLIGLAGFGRKKLKK